MNIKEFLSSPVGKYITLQMERGIDCHISIASLEQPGEIQCILKYDLYSNCSKEEFRKHMKSGTLYECTSRGRYLKSCIQYAKEYEILIGAYITNNIIGV